jgi:uncharacterized membrane protein
MNILDLLPNLLLAISLAGLVTFQITYARAANWRKTKPGRAMMYLITSMETVLVMAFAHLWLGATYPGNEFVRIAVYGFMTAAIWRFVYVLYRSLKVDPFYIFRVRRSPRK